MKRLILVACLAMAALVVTPLATANAELHSKAVLSGTCLLEGTATFGEPITNIKKKVTYSFARGPVGAGIAEGCEGTASEGEKKEIGKFKLVTATVTQGNEFPFGSGKADKGEIGCLPDSFDSPRDVSFEGAIAKLKVEKTGSGNQWVATSYFYFKSTKLAGEIEANLNSKEGGGGNTATGFANFVGPGSEAAKALVLANCANPLIGNLTLPFETAQEPEPPRVGGRAFGIWGTLGE